MYYYTKLHGEYAMRQKISASDGATFDFLGDRTSKVAIDGNIILASTRNGHKVYDFMQTYDIWEEVAELDAPANATYFGHLQDALSHSTALVASAANVYSYTLDCQKNGGMWCASPIAAE